MTRSLLVVDDSDAVRTVMREFLGTLPNWKIGGEARDGAEAIQKAKELKPDMILLDVHMPRMNGIEAASVLKKMMPDVPVILFTMFDEFVGPKLSSAIGVDLVIPKSAGVSHLVKSLQQLMETHGPVAVEAADRCSALGCDQRPRTVFDSRHLCLEHFMTESYDTLVLVSENRKFRFTDPAIWESASQIIQECAQSASAIAQQTSEISNLERARLLDIVLWASELGRQIRRSPRSTSPVDIRLISERSGRRWEEKTHTLDMSRYGARTHCQHTVENGDVLTLVRVDTGEQMEVRIVWQRRTSPGTTEIGIEFVNRPETIEG